MLLYKMPISPDKFHWQGGLLWPKVWWSWWRRICLQRTNAHQITWDQVQVAYIFPLFWVEDGNSWDWSKILSQARELLLQQVWSWQLDHHHRLQAGHCRVNSDILPNQLASKEWMRFANLVYSSLHHYKIDLLYHFKQPGGVIEAESRQGLHPDHLCRALLWQLRWVQPWS